MHFSLQLLCLFRETEAGRKQEPGNKAVMDDSGGRFWAQSDVHRFIQESGGGSCSFIFRLAPVKAPLVFRGLFNHVSCHGGRRDQAEGVAPLPASQAGETVRGGGGRGCQRPGRDCSSVTSPAALSIPL